MEMKGVGFHRNLYSKAGLYVRPQATNNKVDLLKQMVGSIGTSQDEIREALQSLAKPHRIQATPQHVEDDKIHSLTELLVDKIGDRLKSSTPGKSTRLSWWARPGSQG